MSREESTKLSLKSTATPIRHFRFCVLNDDYKHIDRAEEIKVVHEENLEPSDRSSCLTDDLSEYEQLHTLKYLLNFLESSLNEKNNFVLMKNKKDILLKHDWNWNLSCCKISYKGPHIRTLEKQIDQLPFIHEHCNFGGTGNELTWDDLFQNKDTNDLINKYLDGVLGFLQSEIDRLEGKSKLKQKHYSKNLEAYMGLVGLHDEKTRNVIRYLFYQSVSCVFYCIPDANYSIKNITKCCKITTKELDKIMYSELFTIFVRPNNRPNQQSLLPKEEISSLVFLVKSGVKDFIDIIVKKTKPTELTLSDFAHIKQREYIKEILSNALKTKAKGVNILIYGKAGTGKTAFAKTLIKEIGVNGYEVDNNARNKYKEYAVGVIGKSSAREHNMIRNSIFETLRVILKDSNDSIIFYDEAEDFFRKNETADQSKQVINDVLENNETPTIWTSNELSPRWIEPSFLRRFTYAIEFDKINIDVLLSLTDKICKKNKVQIDKRIQELIKQEQPSIGIIEKCIKTYKLSGSKDVNCLYEGLRDLIYTSRYAFDKPKDINRNQTHDYNQRLANTDVKLETVTNGIIKSGKNDWSMILYGVSGTGKTAYADFLGKTLNMRVIKKKVSDLQSMWVGECERNIDRAFEEAREQNAILLFDEGDCWLRDRRYNRNSWETSQGNQFLQCMESATTPVIITTNLMETLDQAALRRFVFKVGFKYMTREQVKEAFKTFFDIDATDEDANIAYATPGDFVVTQKQLEYMGEKPTPAMIKKLLLEEIKNKKDDFKENGIKI